MKDSVALGIGSLSIPPGTHICAFFRGVAERDAIVVPFLAEGLRRGDKCNCLLDDGIDAVRAAVAANDSVRPEVKADQLVINSSKETYLRRGRFSAKEMLDFWNDSVSTALHEEGFPFVRSTGEKTWTLKELPSLEDFLIYESELNRFLPRYPQVILCLYDLEHYGGEILVDILKTHPKVLMGETVLENLYYLEPDEFLASRK
jgi:hypothetical protein